MKKVYIAWSDKRLIQSNQNWIALSKTYFQTIIIHIFISYQTLETSYYIDDVIRCTSCGNKRLSLNNSYRINVYRFGAF
jgi:hypothetical protein